MPASPDVPLSDLQAGGEDDPQQFGWSDALRSGVLWQEGGLPASPGVPLSEWPTRRDVRPDSDAPDVHDQLLSRLSQLVLDNKPAFKPPSAQAEREACPPGVSHTPTLRAETARDVFATKIAIVIWLEALRRARVRRIITPDGVGSVPTWSICDFPVDTIRRRYSSLAMFARHEDAPGFFALGTHPSQRRVVVETNPWGSYKRASSFWSSAAEDGAAAEDRQWPAPEDDHEAAFQEQCRVVTKMLRALRLLDLQHQFEDGVDPDSQAATRAFYCGKQDVGNPSVWSFGVCHSLESALSMRFHGGCAGATSICASLGTALNIPSGYHVGPVFGLPREGTEQGHRWPVFELLRRPATRHFPYPRTEPIALAHGDDVELSDHPIPPEYTGRVLVPLEVLLNLDWCRWPWEVNCDPSLGPLPAGLAGWVCSRRNADPSLRLAPLPGWNWWQHERGPLDIEDVPPPEGLGRRLARLWYAIQASYLHATVSDNAEICGDLVSLDAMRRRKCRREPAECGEVERRASEDALWDVRLRGLPSLGGTVASSWLGLLDALDPELAPFLWRGLDVRPGEPPSRQIWAARIWHFLLQVLDAFRRQFRKRLDYHEGREARPQAEDEPQGLIDLAMALRGFGPVLPTWHAIWLRRFPPDYLLSWHRWEEFDDIVPKIVGR